MGTCCGESYALFEHTPPQTPHGDVTKEESQETHRWVLRVVFSFLVHFHLLYVHVNFRCKSYCCSFCCGRSICHFDCSHLRCICRRRERKRVFVGRENAKVSVPPPNSWKVKQKERITQQRMER